MCIFFKFLSFPDICPGVGLDITVTIFSLRRLHTVFHRGCTNYLTPNSAGGSFSPHSHQHLSFTICRLFGDGHSDWSEVMPLCSFDFHFSNNEQS